MKKKILMMLLAASLAFGATGTCLAASSAASLLDLDATVNTGVSFAQTPVISGQGSGETLYVVSGAYSPADVPAAGTGVSVWELSPDLEDSNVVWSATAAGISAVTSSFLNSPVLKDNGAAGNSVFFVYSPVDPNTALPNSVTGFVLHGLSAQANGTDVASLTVESGDTNLYVPGPLAASGSSLYFGTASVLWQQATLAGAGLPANGATVFCVNMDTAGTITPASGNVTVRNEGGVSGFLAGPVISDNGSSGLSIYLVGFGAGAGGLTGNTIFGYDDTELNTGAAASTQNGSSVGAPGVPVLATPALGTGALSAANEYSGNSLFVVDSVGGISVYNKDTLAFEYARTYGVQTYGLPIVASPLTNGRYLVLCSDAGVSV
jgi:hypothetical protein